MNGTKKRWIGGGAGATVLTTVIVLWQAGMIGGKSTSESPTDMEGRIALIEQRVDGLETTDAALMSEIIESRKAREDLTKEVATLTAELKRTHEMQMVILGDIKGLLRR